MGSFLEIWKSFPSWLKWPLAIIVVPNLIIISILFLTLFVPWHYSTILATINPIEERRDIQIKSMLEMQTLQYQNINDNIKMIQQHQGLMYQALLNRQTSLTSLNNDR